MNYSLHGGNEQPDGVWDPVPGEAPVVPMPDYELGVPASYFEYEIDNRLHYQMVSDQQFIPESERPCPVPKNPNCSSDIWQPQADLEEEHNMEDNDWVPRTRYNIYNSDKFVTSEKSTLDQNSKL
jgi:hypothetical protein